MDAGAGLGAQSKIKEWQLPQVPLYTNGVSLV